MALLRKVKAASMVETLVATVLIIMVFMISSLILNNLFAGVVKSNTHSIESYLTETEYKLIHKKIKLPYVETYNYWDIQIMANNTFSEQLTINCINKVTGRRIERELNYDISE